MAADFRFCPQCATSLEWISRAEDGGDKLRLRCVACDWTHWNNPTPVLAAIIEYRGQVLLARNAAWSGRMFALITGFMEAGETPEEGIAREIKEETNLDVLSLELVEYKLLDPQDVMCWPAGTGLALAQWLRGRGIEPRFIEFPRREE